MGNPKGSRGRPESPLEDTSNVCHGKENKYAAEGVKQESDEVCEIFFTLYITNEQNEIFHEK